MDDICESNSQLARSQQARGTARDQASKGASASKYDFVKARHSTFAIDIRDIQMFPSIVQETAPTCPVTLSILSKSEAKLWT